MRKTLYILAFLIPFIGFSQEPIIDYNFVKGSLLDQSGTNNGINHGAIFKIASKGMTLRFDGNDYLDITSANNLGIDNAIVIWCKFRSGYPGTLIGKKTYWRGQVIYQGSNNTELKYKMWRTNQSSAMTSTWSDVVDCSKDYCIIFNRVADTDSVTLFVNGVDKGGTAHQAIYKTYLDLIGSRGADGAGGSLGYYFNGDIYRIMAYDCSLSQNKLDEIYTDFLNSKTIISHKRNYTIEKPTDLSGEIGLVAAYNMKPTDGELIDISGNGNTGTINGAISTKDGLAFDGSDYVDCGNDISVQLSDVTIYTRIKPKTSTVHGSHVITKQANYNLTSLGYGIYYRHSIIPRELWFNIGDGGNGIKIKHDLIDDIEYLVCGTYNSITKKAILYVNGIEVVSGTNGSMGSIVNNIHNLKIGGNTTFFKGNINITKIYDYAHSPNEVKAYHNSWALQIYLTENFEGGNGADGIVKVPREWSYNSTADLFIGEKADGTKYMEWDNSGTAIFFINLDGLVDNGWVKSLDYYNGSVWSDESGVTVSALSTAEAWFDYSDKKLTFTGTAGKRIANIIIQKGEPQ